MKYWRIITLVKNNEERIKQMIADIQEASKESKTDLLLRLISERLDDSLVSYCSDLSDFYSICFVNKFNPVKFMNKIIKDDKR